jgi:hypothetical protein
MKCRNCGRPREEHVEGTNEIGQHVWKCPDGSGETFPASMEIKVELHYRTGDDSPWVARWEHPLLGVGEVRARRAEEALEAAGRQLERGFEGLDRDDVRDEGSSRPGASPSPGR